MEFRRVLFRSDGDAREPSDDEAQRGTGQEETRDPFMPAGTAHVPPTLPGQAGPRQGGAWPPFFRRAKLAFLRRRAMAEQSGLIKGLEGVVAAETALCDLDGANGRLAYRGYDIADLARQASYEEVAHLLWRGELPTRAQLDGFAAELVAARAVPDALTSAFRLLPKKADPMRALQMAAAVLGIFDLDAAHNSQVANLGKAPRL